MKNLILLTTSFILLMVGNVCAQNITYNSPWHYVNSPHGYIAIGPANTSGAHIYTNRSKFYFNKPVWAITGEFSAYSTKDLKLQTNGITRMTILRSNGNTGIGTTTPAYKLHVAGDMYSNWVRTAGSTGLYFQSHGGGFRMTDNTWIRTFGNKSFYHNTGIMRTDGTFQVGANGGRFLVKTNGNVGIGTTTPAYKLHVAGDMYSNWVRTAGSTGLYFQSHGGGFRMTDNTWIRTFGNKSFYHNTGIMRTDGTFQVGGNGSRFLVNTNGNVGIGTTTPDNKLDVNGIIRAKEIKVESGWSDYVFYNDYQLPTLEEEEKHIEANGHLLGFESEQDMEGMIHLGDVSRRQQAKIEEIILHLIDMKKEMTELREENEELKKLLKTEKE